MATLRFYPNLQISGAYDRDDTRLAAFSRHFQVRRYNSLHEVLSDPLIDAVLNLTNPASHSEITRACLLAGKHVYSEKPLAMGSVEAMELVTLARQNALRLAVAPCSMLSVTCQTMWKALAGGAIGPVRLVYASFNDGMTHRLNPERWRSASNAPWPVKDEFETGCTYEHAAYLLSWLAAWFGPARRVTAYASCRIPDKGVAPSAMAPDFSTGCIEYDNDVLVRLTCSAVAPVDKSILIIGEAGTLYTKCVRDDASPVYITRTPPGRIANAIGTHLSRFKAQLESWIALPWSVSGLSIKRRVRWAFRPRLISSGFNKPVDFMIGLHELAEAIREGRPCRLSPELGAHLIEIVETLQYPERFERTRELSSSFDPIAPLSWVGPQAVQANGAPRSEGTALAACQRGGP